MDNSGSIKPTLTSAVFPSNCLSNLKRNLKGQKKNFFKKLKIRHLSIFWLGANKLGYIKHSFASGGGGIDYVIRGCKK